MALTSLPLEVLEIILLHLDAKDLRTLCDTINIKVNDYFWKQVCKREGYVQPPENDHSWRAVFQLNHNWASEKYVKRDYKFDYPERNLVEHIMQNGNIEYFIHGQNLLIQLDHFSISVWNVEESPNLVQTLKSRYLTSAGTKILTMDLCNLFIYSVCDKIYKELVKIDVSSEFVLPTDYNMTDDFFAAFDNKNDLIKIVNLRDLDIFDLNHPSKRRLNLNISHEILYIMAVKEAKYIMTRYDLVKKVELDDIILFPGAYMISVPVLKTSSKLIVSWSHEFETNSLTPIKVWKTNGDLLRVLPIDFVTSFGTQTVTGSHRIMWSIVEGDYLILSTSHTRIIIWCSTEPEICKEISKDLEHYNGQKTVSSTLLILSYTHCFKVVDFKRATYLYEVYFDSPNLNSICTHFFANHYYYGVLQAGSSPAFSNAVNYTNCVLCIYDFRAK